MENQLWTTKLAKDVAVGDVLYLGSRDVTVSKIAAEEGGYLDLQFSDGTSMTVDGNGDVRIPAAKPACAPGQHVWARRNGKVVCTSCRVSK